MLINISSVNEENMFVVIAIIRSNLTISVIGKNYLHFLSLYTSISLDM